MVGLSRHWSFILVSAVGLAAACRPASQPGGDTTQTTNASPAEDRAAVEAAVQSHWAAINSGDTVTIYHQHTPDLTLFVTETERRFTMPSPTSDSLLARVWRGSRPSFAVRDLEIQLYGDAAVATFHLDGGTTLPNGTRDPRRRRVTEVWARQADGTWKEVHHHDSVFAPR